MENEFIGGGGAGWLYGSLGGVIGLAGNYLVRLVFDRKKLKSENDSDKIDIDTKAVKLYQDFANDMTPRMEQIQKQNDEIVSNFNKLRIENADIIIENKQLKYQNTVLHNENKQLKDQNESLNTQLLAIHQDLREIKEQVKS